MAAVTVRILARCARAPLAFGCGYLVAGAVSAAFTHDFTHSSTPVFEFTETVLIVAFFGTLSALGFSAGTLLRSIRQTAAARVGTRHAALMGAGCVGILWLLALSPAIQPTELAGKGAVLAVIMGVPGCLGYYFGRGTPK